MKRSITALLIISAFLEKGQAASDTLNYTDENGLKQGWWEYGEGLIQVIHSAYSFFNYPGAFPDTVQMSSCRLRGKYLNGQKHGEWTTYLATSDGRLSGTSIVRFDHDTLVGDINIYHGEDTPYIMGKVNHKKQVLKGVKYHPSKFYDEVEIPLEEVIREYTYLNLAND